MNKKIMLAVFYTVLAAGIFAGGTKDKTETVHVKKQGEVIIVNLSPPVYSMLQTFPGLKDSVAGVNPRTFSTSNPKVLAAVNPNAKNLNSSFLNNDFSVNAESLAALEPTIILYYGEFEKKGLDNLSIPMVNMQINDMDSESLTQKWEKMIADIFKTDNGNKMEKQWTKTNEILSATLKDGKNIRGLFIFSTVGGKIMVSGNKSYGGNFLRKAGIENVAELDGFAEGAGQVEVSMEQINEWNPDIIFINSIRIGKNNTSAKTILENTDTRNWSFIKAVKDKKVFDIPQGTFSWGMPCADSPLMPLWMLTKIAPEKYSEFEFKKKIKTYYKEVYDTELEDAVIDEMLSPLK